jgi:predicted anti-sigma-YlaC factor YlaD
MDCTSIREALSAQLDGEEPGIDGEILRRHLASCAACRAFVDETRFLQDALRFARLPPPAGLGSRVVARHLEARSPRRLADSPVRTGLVLVAVAQVILAVPGLVLGDDQGAPIHIAHEMGSWEVALAIGFLFAAWRPLRAVGMVPFAFALAACLIGTALFDLVHGRTSALVESSHLLAVAGSLLLWQLAHPRAHRTLVAT